MKPYDLPSFFPIRLLLVGLLVVGVLFSGKSITGIPKYSEEDVSQLKQNTAPRKEVALDALSPSLEITDFSNQPVGRYRVSIALRFPEKTTPPTSVISTYLAQAGEESVYLDVDGLTEESTTRVASATIASKTQRLVSSLVEKTSLDQRLVLRRENVQLGPLYAGAIFITRIQADTTTWKALPADRELAASGEVLDVTNWSDTYGDHASRDQVVSAALRVGYEANLTMLEFPMHVTGSGGNGKYHLELREGQAVGTAKILAAYDFHIDDAGIQSSKLLSSTERLLNIPLAMPLAKDRTYWVVLDPANVATNLLHNARPYLKNGNFLVRAYGESADIQVANELLEEVGPGERQYTYAFQGVSQDVLALDRDAVLRQRDQGNLTFFDTIQGSVVGSVGPGAYLQYRLQVPDSRVASASLESTALANGLRALEVWYSFDEGLTWKELQAAKKALQNSRTELSPQLNGQLSGSGASLLIQFRPKGPSELTPQLPAYGLKGLTIKAKVLSE